MCIKKRDNFFIQKEDKAKIIARYKVGDVIKGAECKGLSSFGAFFNVNGEMDCLVHLQEIQYSRLNHPDEVLSVGEKRSQSNICR